MIQTEGNGQGLEMAKGKNIEHISNIDDLIAAIGATKGAATGGRPKGFIEALNKLAWMYSATEDLVNDKKNQIGVDKFNSGDDSKIGKSPSQSFYCIECNEVVSDSNEHNEAKGSNTKKGYIIINKAEDEVTVPD